MEGIAARAGVGKQTIYRWWPSKGAVVFDALLHESRSDQDAGIPDTGKLGADLQALLRATAKELAEPRRDALFRALLADVQANEALANELMTRLLLPQHNAMRGRLKRARKAKQLAAGVDLDVAVEIVFGPMLRRWLLRTGPLDNAFADSVAALAANALQA